MRVVIAKNPLIFMVLVVFTTLGISGLCYPKRVMAEKPSPLREGKALKNKSQHQTSINIRVISLNIEDVVGEDGQVYQKLSIPGAIFSTQKEGFPQVPIIRKMVQISAQAVNVKLKARYKGEPTTYNDLLVYPSPKMVIEKDIKGFRRIKELFRVKKKAYRKNKFIPRKIAEIEKDGFFRSTRMLAIHAYPVRYNPKQRLCEFYHTIEVTISYQIDKRLPEEKDNTKYFKPLLRRMLKKEENHRVE